MLNKKPKKMPEKEWGKLLREVQKAFSFLADDDDDIALGEKFSKELDIRFPKTCDEKAVAR